MDKVKAKKLLKKLCQYFRDEERYEKTVYKEMEKVKNVDKVIDELEKKKIYAPIVPLELIADLIIFLDESIAEES